MCGAGRRAGAGSPRPRSEEPAGLFIPKQSFWEREAGCQGLVWPPPGSVASGIRSGPSWGTDPSPAVLQAARMGRRSARSSCSVPSSPVTSPRPTPHRTSREPSGESGSPLRASPEVSWAPRGLGLSQRDHSHTSHFHLPLSPRNSIVSFLSPVNSNSILLPASTRRFRHRRRSSYPYENDLLGYRLTHHSAGAKKLRARRQCPQTSERQC